MAIKNTVACDAVEESNPFQVTECVETGCKATVVRSWTERGQPRCSDCRAKRVDAILLAKRRTKVRA